VSEITEILVEVQEVSEEILDETIVREEEISGITVKKDTKNISEKGKTFFKRNVPVYDVSCLWHQQFFTEHR
jgi:hypothetical protein